LHDNATCIYIRVPGVYVCLCLRVVYSVRVCGTTVCVCVYVCVCVCVCVCVYVDICVSAWCINETLDCLHNYIIFVCIIFVCVYVCGSVRVYV